MQSIKFVKVQIYLTDQEKKSLLDTMEAFKNGCNFVSSYVFESNCTDSREIRNETYYDLRSQFNLPSQMACNVCRVVAGAYKSIIANKREWVKCKFKKPQLVLSWNRDCSLVGDTLSIKTLDKRIRVNFAKKGWEKYFNNPEISFGAVRIVVDNNKFYACISVRKELNELSLLDIKEIVGLDRGVRFLATAYDGENTVFYSGKEMKQKRAKNKALRSELQPIKTPSGIQKLKKINGKERRWVQNTNHCIAKDLVERYPEGTLFVLEDLNGIKEASLKVKLKDNYVLVSWPYDDFEKKLIYKAAEKGQKVIKVQRAYTSQTCPICHHVDKANRDKKKHIFKCRKCGYTSNDDRVAAMNLYQKGVEAVFEYWNKESEVKQIP